MIEAIKPKSSSELRGVLGLAAFVLGRWEGRHSNLRKGKYKNSTTTRQANKVKLEDLIF